MKTLKKTRGRTLATLLIAIFMISASTVSLVMAKGPTNAGGIKPIEEYVMPLAPYNDNAFWHSGQYIGPDFGWGTETTIVEDGVTITVSEIPVSIYNEETEEWEGTHLMWKANYNAEEYSFSMKFWLNGAGPVDITYDYGGEQETKQATEFIFFKSGYVDNVWTDTLQAYK